MPGIQYPPGEAPVDFSSHLLVSSLSREVSSGISSCPENCRPLLISYLLEQICYLYGLEEEMAKPLVKKIMKYLDDFSKNP